MSADEIVKRETAIFFNLTRREIEGQGKARRFTLPRQVAMTLCRRYTSRSTITIGKRFGGRDHTTVLHATKATIARMQDPDFAHQVSQICALVEQELNARRCNFLNRQIRPIALLPPPPPDPVLSAWKRYHGAQLGPLA